MYSVNCQHDTIPINAVPHRRMKKRKKKKKEETEVEMEYKIVVRDNKSNDENWVKRGKKNASVHPA